MPQKVWGDYVFLGIGAIILIIVLNKSFDILSWTQSVSPGFKTLAVTLIIVLIVIAVIIGSSRAKPTDTLPSSLIMRKLAQND